MQKPTLLIYWLIFDTILLFSLSIKVSKYKYPFVATINNIIWSYIKKVININLCQKQTNKKCTPLFSTLFKRRERSFLAQQCTLRENIINAWKLLKFSILWVPIWYCALIKFTDQIIFKEIKTVLLQLALVSFMIQTIKFLHTHVRIAPKDLNSISSNVSISETVFLFLLKLCCVFKSKNFMSL